MAEWRAVVGYEGLYEVSDGGQVRSLPKRASDGRLYRGRVLKLTRRHCNSQYVNLHKPGQGRRFRQVHQLVLEAFVGPRPEGNVTRHLDGNAQNNQLNNLAWGTQAENIQDAIRHGTHFNARKTHCKWGHEFTKENTYIYRGNSRMCRACLKRRSNERKELR